MKPARRMGPKGSEIWHAMLDAAEQIMQDQGYGKLTSRSVADQIGVKQRLVYYYFSTMDELIVEAFRRAAARENERLVQALASKHSIREIWQVYIETTDTKLVSEFVALSHRIDALGKEVKGHIEECRKLQVHALEQAMAANAIKPVIPPIAATIFANAAMLTLHHEAGIGLTDGHAEVLKVIADFIGLHDPAD